MDSGKNWKNTQNFLELFKINDRNIEIEFKIVQNKNEKFIKIEIERNDVIISFIFF